MNYDDVIKNDLLNAIKVPNEKPPYYHNGLEECNKDDPSRYVFYSAKCTYWTDDFSKLGRTGFGIPCCPVCGMVGFQCTFEEWIINVLEHTVRLKEERYLGYIDSIKEKHLPCSFDVGFKQYLFDNPK